MIWSSAVKNPSQSESIVPTCINIAIKKSAIYLSRHCTTASTPPDALQEVPEVAVILKLCCYRRLHAREGIGQLQWRFGRGGPVKPVYQYSYEAVIVTEVMSNRTTHVSWSLTPCQLQGLLGLLGDTDNRNKVVHAIRYSGRW